MHTLIIQESRIIYVDPQTFDETGTRIYDAFDSRTTTANATAVIVDSLPPDFAPWQWTWDGTKPVIKPEYHDEWLGVIKTRKLAEINNAYQQAIAALTPTYPNDERLTFDKQEHEARAWLADNSTPTPFVDALAAGRQMDKAELVSRIIAKADAFALASGSLTGQRQRYEDMLDVAETPEDVASIVPVYSLPGTEAQA